MREICSRYQYMRGKEKARLSNVNERAINCVNTYWNLDTRLQEVTKYSLAQSRKEKEKSKNIGQENTSKYGIALV